VEVYNRLLSGGHPPKDPDCAPSYLDFLHDDRLYWSSAQRERDEQFWRLRFAENSDLLTSRPFSRISPASTGCEPVSWVIARRAFEQLSEMAARQGASVAQAMLALVGLYLARLADLPGVVIGVPVLNRSARYRQTFGMFASVLPISIRVNRDERFGDLLRSVAVELRRCYRHSRLPTADISRALRIAQQGRNQLFDVTVSFEKYRVEAALGEARLTTMPVRMGVGQVPLEVAVNDHSDLDDVRVEFFFDPEIHRRADIEAMRTHLGCLLEAIILDPECELGRLPLMDVAQRKRIIESFNATQVQYSQELLVHELFEEQVRRSPDAVAVVYEGQSLTYSELNSRANQLARYLRGHGVGPEELVALYVERGLEMVVGLLGVMKAGGAYVPLDPAYPLERVAYMLADAAPRVLLTQERLRGRLPPTGAEVLPLDGRWDQISREDSRDLQRGAAGAGSERLAYVIYTSGSTGKPKGVMVTQAGVVNFLAAMREQPGMGSSDCLLAVTSLSFDIAALEIYLPLLNGAKVVLASREAAADGDCLIKLIEEFDVTVLQGTPATWRVLLSAGWQGRPGLTALCGGEALTTELARQLEPRVGVLWNLYGPTETTIWSCSGRISVSGRTMAEEEAGGRVESIGRPIANTQIYILDSQLQPVPIGVTGEIYIGGAGVARGYLNRPELTAERFLQAPFSACARSRVRGMPRTGEVVRPDPGQTVSAQGARSRMYRTGDLGRWRADGSIGYVGRNDHQVKIRGFRIELGEIESRLLQYAGLQEAAVLAREDIPGEMRLVAYVSLREDGRASVEQLRAHLQEVLPDYMVPGAFVVLKEFPLTPNGKVDRQALPAPEAGVSSRRYEAPQGEIEQALALIWQDLLQVERVGREDNFFELGGHSLLAVRLLTRVRQGLGRKLELRDVFECPALQSMAARLGRSLGLDLPPILPADRSRPLLLSWAQQRLWFIDQLEGAGAAYHIAGAMRLHGELDREALQAALDAVIERHEVLRTRFVRGGHGEVYQQIAAPESFPLTWVDLSAHALAQRNLLTARELREEASAGFDLSEGPLIRGSLVRLSTQEHVLSLRMHHIVADGWSVGVLIREVAALYGAYRDKRPYPFMSLPIQYADYAQWQRQHLTGEVLQESLQYWKERLRGAPERLELPTDRPRPSQMSYRGASVPVVLDAQISAELRGLARQQDATLFMVLHAAWALLMSRLSGQADVVIGVPVANRQRREVEGLIGFFVNMLALRVQVQAHSSVGELVQQVKELTLQAYSHQDAPFEQVVEAVQPPRHLNHTPLFQVALVLQNTPQEELRLPGLSLQTEPLEVVTEQFDLTLELQESGECIEGRLSYASDLFERATIERWVGHFRCLVAAMAQDMHSPIGRLPLLSEAERERLLVQWNDTAVEYGREGLIHELFEEQVRRSPQAPAVVYEDQQLSYGQLNAKANQLAHYLRSQGVGPEQRVGICVERSLEMVVGILGVWKAGGAYVPLDPGYPAERLRYMLEDAAPGVLLTQDKLRGSLPDTRAKVVSLDGDWPEIAAQNSEDPSRAPGSKAENLAYVIYTSGSTGKPKGVMIEHGNVSILWRGLEEAYKGMGDCRRIALNSSFNFDASVQQFIQLLSGRTVYVVPQEYRLDPAKMVRFIAAHGIHGIDCTPSQLKLWLGCGLLAQKEPELKVVLVGGESIDPELWSLLAKSPQINFYNVYGPTECTVEVTMAVLRGDTGGPHIGRPMQNRKVYVLDRDGRPVPIGVSGEIYLGGAGVGRGYLNSPEMTLQRFIPDPFSGVAQGRLYKTGDVGRWRSDGTIEYLGRNDHQVKIRGFRIELGEIESQLLQYPGLREAAVLAREDSPGEARLVAYVRLQEERASVESLRAHLQGVLPQYMVPSAFVVMEEFPLTPSGKLDRKALPAPDQDALHVSEYEAPQGLTEESLALIWQDLLQVERVGRHDNFFDLGGNSLLAVKLVSRLRAWTPDCPVMMVFQRPTIQALAQFLLTGSSAGPDGPDPIVLRSGTAGAPLFFVHEITGHAFPYVSLARLLKKDIPVYCLQATDLARTDPGLTVEMLANRHIAAIRRIQPRGPYRLAGWSFGGVVAYEIASQLLAAGQSVEFLGMIDSYTPALRRALFPSSGPLTAMSALVSLVREEHPDLDAATLESLRGLTDLDAVLEACMKSGYLPAEWTHEAVMSMLGPTLVLSECYERYSPPELPLSISLFSAERSPGEDDLLGWGSLVRGEVHLTLIGGTHWSMMRSPLVQHLADALSRCLDFSSPASNRPSSTYQPEGVYDA
jgi:amino acid adenylation domain-containing protein